VGIALSDWRCPPLSNREQSNSLSGQPALPTLVQTIVYKILNSDVAGGDPEMGSSVELAILEISGFQPAKRGEMNVLWSGVMPNYLKTLGVPLIAGRGITESDRPGATPVAIINRSAAVFFLHGLDRRGAPGGDGGSNDRNQRCATSEEIRKSERNISHAREILHLRSRPLPLKASGLETS